MCDGRVEVIQSIDEAALQYCPQCGMEVRRVISRASFKMSRPSGVDKAAAKGFTTWKRVEEGKWEKVGGQGVDMIVGSEEDMKAVKEEKIKPKVVDLDAI